MKKILTILLFLNAAYFAKAQSVEILLQQKVNAFLKDKNMADGILGFTVLDAVTGKLVFEKNSNIGLPMASTQKSIIAIASLQKLTPNYTYATSFSSVLQNADTLLLSITASGDPSLASYIFVQDSVQKLMQSIANSLPEIKNIKCIKYSINNKNNIDSSLCKAWTWEDMGNYYGAPAQAFNWRENTVDVLMNGASEVNGKTNIQSTVPKNTGNFINLATTDVTTSGDGTNIYRAPFAKESYITGTIPQASKDFEINASLSGKYIFESEFAQYLLDNNYVNQKPIFVETQNINIAISKNMYKYNSPNLDSLVKHFMRKSINVYGEAFLKTLGAKEYSNGTYTNGLRVINNFTKQIGIDTHSVHIFDGSGLSPQNRITTKALCKYLLYAKTKPWFTNFYEALPVINGISMKSGSIHQTRAYTGFVNSKNGKQYVFAIVAHNYDGSGKVVQQKLWQILDVLK